MLVDAVDLRWMSALREIFRPMQIRFFDGHPHLSLYKQVMDGLQMRITNVRLKRAFSA